MIEWTKQLRVSFGASFLWLICLIYFTQGFRSFLKLSPSASQFVFSIAFFPWSMKPLYGIISDCILIKGRKRIPSIFLFFHGPFVTTRSSTWNLILLVTLQNQGSAMADVVIDAMIAEAVRSERAAFAGDLQSVSWFSMATGGICRSLLGGYALSNLEIRTIFLLFYVLPTIQFFSCGLAEQGSIVSEPLFESLKSENPDLINRYGNVTDDDYSLTKKSDSNTFSRKT
uniref:Uncharacterized protein n=1 Tax=Kalanchoe fedtschenkoi TaxID=63787 RepID=A0A7N0URC5_KALFE